MTRVQCSDCVRSIRHTAHHLECRLNPPVIVKRHTGHDGYGEKLFEDLWEWPVVPNDGFCSHGKAEPEDEKE